MSVAFLTVAEFPKRNKKLNVFLVFYNFPHFFKRIINVKQFFKSLKIIYNDN